MKKFMLCAILILSVLMVYSPAATVMDNFNDGVIGSSWQVSTANGGSVNEINGCLKQTTVNGVRGSQAYLKSNFGLQGNFDAMIDFSLIAFSDYWSSACLTVSLDENNWMGIYISYSGDHRKHYETTYAVNGVENPAGYVYTPPLDINQGRLRLSRSGSDITAYYWAGSDWNTLMTRTVSDELAKFSFHAMNDGLQGSAPFVEVHWDNFIAIPEPCTLALLGLGGLLLRRRNK